MAANGAVFASLLASAVVFVAILRASYGLDLSVAFF